MVSLIVTDAKHKPLRAVDDYTLDLAYGSDENSFKLTCLPQPESSALIMIDGTEYGGLVTVRNTDGSVEGPTWHGLLSRRILQPDTGRDYLTVSGAAGDVLNMLFKRIGLDALFTASARHAVTIGSYSFDRYTDAYTGIRKMLAANNAKLRLIWADGRVNAYALPVEHYGDSIDSDLLEFKASLDSQPVNHLIGLGTGELKDRAVVHWYADVNGNVSQTQSLTGLAERQAVYDYSNAKPDELNTETRKKLIELQSQGGVEVTITDNTLSMDVGDTVTGRDNRLGITLTVPVAKKIVKSSGGILSVDYECGTASGDTTSLSGSAESNGSTGSGGSGTYYADGVTITMRNNTFSAVVTPSRVDDVEKTAKDAYTLASNYSAEIGKAQQDSVAAIAAAAMNVASITTAMPLSASRNGQAVHITATEATAEGSGLMSAADKRKLDGLENYALPAATIATLGGVRPDGSTITVNEDGVITAHATSTGNGILFPVGYVVMNTTGSDPANDFGGVWGGTALPGRAHVGKDGMTHEDTGPHMPARGEPHPRGRRHQHLSPQMAAQGHRQKRGHGRQTHGPDRVDAPHAGPPRRAHRHRPRPLHAPGHGRDHHHPRPGRGHARPARGRGRVGPAPRRPLGRRDPPGRRVRACRNHRERHRKEAALIRALDGCSCDEGPVIILEDAIIGDVSIVYATDADIDNLFPTPTTDKEEHDG